MFALWFFFVKSKNTTSYLFLEEAVEDEDEHPLQRVEDGEEVSHHDGRIVEEEQAKGPRQPQKTKQGERSQHPRPEEEEEEEQY